MSKLSSFTTRGGLYKLITHSCRAKWQGANTGRLYSTQYYYDIMCSCEDNYWKGRLEMPDMDYLQPKTVQVKGLKSLQENPRVAPYLDFDKERDCRILKSWCMDEADIRCCMSMRFCPEMSCCY